MNVNQLSAEERVRRAAERADKLVDHVRTLLLVHESNAVVLYSGTLADQIPRSYAGHAFNQFQRSMYLFELVRLAAVWDGYGTDRESIPTIVALIDDAEIIRAVTDRRRARYLDAGAVPNIVNADSRPAEEIREIFAWFARDREKDAAKLAETTEDALREVIERSKLIAASPELEALREIRNYEIAHNLGMPQRGDEASDVDRWRYGGESALLEATVEVTDALYGALNNTSFMWEDARDHARRNAKQLWENCTFSIPRRD